MGCDSPCPSPVRPLDQAVNTISTKHYAQAFVRQKRLTDAAWLQRCDELAIEQRVLFMELLTFGRDGLNASATRALIDYLSVLQAIADTVAKHASVPVEMPEFQAAILRTGQFFHAADTDDRDHSARITKAWFKVVVDRREPVVWNGCIETLQQHGILTSPLIKDAVVTLWAIADIYSRRFSEGPPHRVAAE